MKVVFFLCAICSAYCCTNFLVTKGASVEGAPMISYAADSHAMAGFLKHYSAGKHAPGEMHKVFNWEDGRYMGEIPEAEYTYNVVGNINEKQLAIAETTYGGREELAIEQKGAILDYGSLIYILLQRADSARAAIEIMRDLLDKYGWASEGETFSLSDKNEVWIMDIIGKANFELGAVWVARKIPDGMISGHANHARITQFPLDKPDECLYSKDAITFAEKRGWWKGKPEDFSFSDIYNPNDFEGTRFCEARVWSMFNKNANVDKWLDYAMGKTNNTERMDLWIKPDKKISVFDMMDFMRDHYENTPMDFRHDVGAQGFGLPYRWRPLFWKVKEKTYFNERSTGTQQSAFVFVTQSRGDMPDPIGAVIWFATDDAGSSVFVPFYGGATAVPKQYAESNTDLMKFSMDNAFWVSNLVSNWAYMRYDTVMVDVSAEIKRKEEAYKLVLAEIDDAAVKLWNDNHDKAIDFITKHSVQQGSQFVEDWRVFFGEMFVKYMDGNVKYFDIDHKMHIDQPGYNQYQLDRIPAETGDRYLFPDGATNGCARKHKGL